MLNQSNINIWHLRSQQQMANVRGIHRSPVDSPQRDQWRGALKFYSICAWINSWVNNCDAGDLRRHRIRYDVIVMGFGEIVWFKARSMRHFDNFNNKIMFYMTYIDSQQCITRIA